MTIKTADACGAFSPDDNYLCTLPRGHGGMHEAHASLDPASQILRTWQEPLSSYIREHALETDAMATGLKPTNPKDAIGILKAPTSTVPMGVIAELGVAMLEGALKYGRHNYRAVGVRTSVYVDAAKRHIDAFWEGEDNDPDAEGLSHVTKAIACLTVLRDAQMQGKCVDDRPPRSVPFYPRLNEIVKRLIDRYGDRKPKHYTIEDKL